MASPSWMSQADSPTLIRSFAAVTTRPAPPPRLRAAESDGVQTPIHASRPQADGHLPFIRQTGRASDNKLLNMPIAAGPQAYHSQFPSFMSVYGIDPSSMDGRMVITGETESGIFPEGTGSLSAETDNSRSNITSQHKHRDSTSTQASESTDSSPTTTISTADSSSLTDPSPSSSPESPVTIIPLSSFSSTTFGVHSLDDLTMSENNSPDHLSSFGCDRPMTSPLPRKARNAKGLALKLPLSGDATQPAPILSPSSTSPAAFFKPPPPKPRKKPSLLSLQTSSTPNPGHLPRLALEAPPTPGLTRPTTLKHHHSSPQILLSPDPRGGSLPAGGMQLPPFERSSVSGLSTAFRKPSNLKEASYLGAASTIEEEDVPIRTQMATRSFMDIRGDIFDNPPSNEDAQSPSYPEGPVMIYEPYVYLYLEPTVEEASKFDVVMNVASEVKNPFQASREKEKIMGNSGGPKTSFDPMDIDRDNIPVPDTAASIATFRTAFEWQPDSQQTPTESSPTTPKPLAKFEPEYIHVPWEHNTEISKELMGLCEIIDSRAKEGKKVLIHCQQGASRSASLIIAYGMYKDPGLSVNDAYHAAQAKSKWISPNMKLMYSLQDFQKELEKKKLIASSSFKRVAGRSPTKHRATLSADAVDLPSMEPLTAPLPGRASNSPSGTPLRLRGNSSPNLGEVLPGPASAPSTFARPSKVDQAPGQFGLWSAFPSEEPSEAISAASTRHFGFSHTDPNHSKGGFFPSEALSLAPRGFGNFPSSSYDTPPDSGFSAQRDQPQTTVFNAFPSLSAAGDPQRDVAQAKDTENHPTQFAYRVVDDAPPTPSLWSPRVQEFTANPLRESFDFGHAIAMDAAPPPPDLMSPRVTEFVQPFRPAPTTNFSRPLTGRAVAMRPVVDPRSPATKGEAPIIRSIDDML